jgi:hypothetical protein
MNFKGSFNKVAGTSLAVIFSASVFAMGDSNAEAQNLVNTNDSSIKILRGLNPRANEKGHISFILDTSSLGFFEKLSYAGGKWPMSAVFFKGSIKDKNRLCPFFNTAGRDYKIEQLETGSDKFLVTATGTKEEIETVASAGCLVTQTPKTSKIIFKHGPSSE